MKRRSSANLELLLLQDIEGLGRKGEIVKAKPGHARNYVIPQKRGVIADAHTLRIQARLKEERGKQAAIDRQEAEQLASQVHGLTCEVHVKVDPEGHMYGSVKGQDIVDILSREGMILKKKYINLPQPIKTAGLHTINLKLKEGVTCSFKLKVLPEGVLELPEEKPPEEKQHEEAQSG